jgi:transcriptional regulator with XRE-family HTH domain
MNIGKLLIGYREVNRKSIRALSKEIGLTIATISRIENGKPVDQNTMLLLINWLFGGQKIKESPNTDAQQLKAEIAALANVLHSNQKHFTDSDIRFIYNKLRQLSAV